MLCAVPIPISFDAVIGASNPRRWYKFNEVSGSTLIDYGTDHINGTYDTANRIAYNQPPLRLGSTGCAAVYNASSTYRMASAPMPSFGTLWSWEIIVLAALGQGNNTNYIENSVMGSYLDNGGDNTSLYYGGTRANNFAVVGCRSQNQHDMFDITNTKGAVTHIGAIRNGNLVTLYIRGVPVASYTNATSDSVGSTIDFCGSVTATTVGFAGRVSDALMYDRDIGATTMARHASLVHIDNKDPFYDKVLLLSRYDNTSDGTNPRDEAGLNGWATGGGGIGFGIITNSNFKWGGASAQFTTTGNGCFKSAQNTVMVSLLAAVGNFTLDGYVYITAYQTGANYSTILTYRTDNGQSILFFINSSGKLGFTIYDISGASYTVLSATTVSLSSWHYIAAIRNGTTMYLYLDSVTPDATSSAIGAAVMRSAGATQRIEIGSDDVVGTGTVLSGFLDSLRVTLAPRTISIPTADFPYP